MAKMMILIKMNNNNGDDNDDKDGVDIVDEGADNDYDD